MMKKYAIGVDIGGTTVKMGLFTTRGELLDSWEIKTRRENDGQNILVDIKNAVEKKIIENTISILDVEGIGMGVPGPVGADGTVFKCVNLGWDVFNVEERMSKLTGLKVKAGNDANVAALGEMWQGGGKGFDNMIMVTLGTGVGGGIIQNGKIVFGNNGAAGEIGHICVRDNETVPCSCGKYGCLEQYASASGIVRSTIQYLEENPNKESALRNINSFTSKDIFACAKQGDTVAKEMIETVTDMLGKALATIACVLDPEAFVIGGGMSNAGDILISAIQTTYRKYAFHSSRETAFCIAELGNAAGIYGGVRMLLE